MHPDPYKVGFLGIGNESWDCGGAMSADYYVSLMKVYSRFVLNMNPAQRTTRTRSSVLARRILGRYEGTREKYTWAWDIDGVSLHCHTVPNGWPPSTSSENFGLDDYAKSLKSTLFMDEFLRKQEAVMDKYDPEKKVTLSVDGSCALYHCGSTPHFLVRQGNIRDAMPRLG